MAWRHVGTISKRLAANLIEQRRKAAQFAELDEDLAAAANPASPKPSQALAVGREIGRQLGRLH